MAEQISIQTMRRLWYLIAETRQQMSNALKKDFARYNMSPRQSYILRTIQELGEDATLKNLSELRDFPLCNWNKSFSASKTI